MSVKLNITETEVPTDLPRGGKKAEPNPYSEHIAKLAEAPRTEDAPGKALTFEVPRDKSHTDEENEKAVRKVVSKWQDGGKEHNVTIRAHVQGNRVTVWAVPRITRNRKPSDGNTANA